MALKLAKAVVEHLTSNPEQKFTARQIAEWVLETYPTECQEKRKSSASLSSDAELLQQLVAEIGSQRLRLQKNSPGIKTTEGRPRKYYFSHKTDSAEVIAMEASPLPSGKDGAKQGEHALYPLVSTYLWAEFRVYSKRIDEKKSSNKRGPNGNRWLYPDLVGMEDVGAEWDQVVRDCVKLYSDKRTKLWSFEVKRLVNRSNVRECYFQAVSNSSWSNFGYLVAAEFEGQDTLRELRMLFGAHGVGVIRFDVEDPLESQVLIPARERLSIDWHTANRLSTENKDFFDYVKLVKHFYQIGEAKLVDWDIPKESE